MSIQPHNQAQSNDQAGLWKKLTGVFTNHPASIGESYFEHQLKALSFSVRLLVMSLAALLHAVIPALCKDTARLRIAALHEELQSRAAPKSD